MTKSAAGPSLMLARPLFGADAMICLPNNGLLTTIPVAEEPSTLPMVAITRADLPLTPTATHLLDLLKRGRVLRASTHRSKKAARAAGRF